jgi:archaellum biogenesis ATPase FlaH
LSTNNVPPASQSSNVGPWSRIRAVLEGRRFETDKGGRLIGRCPKCAKLGFIACPNGRAVCPSCEIIFATHDELAETLMSTLGMRLCEVKRERVEFYGGRIPRGKITIVEGDPGEGKSLLVAYSVGALTTGRSLLGDSTRDPEIVLMLAYEDDAGATLRPRLEAAGADLERVHILSTPEKPLTLDEDGIKKIRELVLMTGASFVGIDPLAAALPAKVNPNSDVQVRNALQPLVAVAGDTGAAAVIVRHLNKSTENARALYRGSGSMGIAGLARSVFLLARDPDNEDRRILAAVKTNLTKTPPSVAFRIVEEAGVPRLEYIGETTHRADDFAVPPMAPEERGALLEGVEFLKSVLSDGPRDQSQVVAEAKEAGISAPTIQRAKRRLGVCSVARRKSDGR